MENYKSTDENINMVGSNEDGSLEVSAPVSSRVSFFEKLSQWIIIALVFLLPVFIYNPFPGFSLDFSKKSILFTGVILALISWLIARFGDGKFSFPGGYLFKSTVLLFSSFFLSSIFLLNSADQSVGQSVFGLGFDTDTLMTMIVMLALMFLSSIYFQSIKRLSYFYIALLSSFVFVLIAEFAQLYTGGKVLADSGLVYNLIGKWNDMGIFFGLGAALSLSAIELLELNLYPKLVIWFVLIASLVSVGIVNYSPVSIMVGVCALISLIYSVFFNGMFKEGEAYSKGKILTRPSFAVLVICVALYFSQGWLGDQLAKYNVVNIDVRPSLSATIDIAQNTMKEGTKNILFGAGPNNFSTQWVKFKPNVVNDTIFWNVDFNSGVGRIPSYAITLGLFGIVSWIIFLGLLLYYGFSTVLYSSIPRSSKFIVFTSFVGVIYLWAFSLVYVTDTVLFALSFMITGVFIASLVKSGVLKNFEFSFLNDPRLGFASVLVLVLLIITSISGGYLISKKFIANYYFQTGMYNLNVQGNLDGALQNIRLASEYDEQDLYFRSLSEINIVSLQKFISEQKISDKESLAKLQEMIVAASANARKSIDLNKSNYLNWVSLGMVGEAVVPLKVVDGSYQLALDSYKKAFSLNPNNPMILLNIARLEIANNDTNKAREYLNQSLQLKSNFTAALYLLSQIEASQGHLKEAIAKAEQAYLFAPNDLGVLFQLGFLKFSNKDYEGSVASLERAISINPQYSNAKYFLGLSYAKLGRNSLALKQFKEISALNPDNDEVRSIIKNLTEGNDPFAKAPVVKAEPEKREKLPVKEN
ncbi:MAG: tetratricopeptide repeat protein [bacterium]